MPPLRCFAARGSPPHLEGIRKVGNGASAIWVVGTYRWRGRSVSFGLGLDRHPGIRASKLLFIDDETGGEDERKRAKMAFMLLEATPDGSALRGMRVSEAYRGMGHSRRFLAIWVALCLTAGCTPSSRTINKPLVALSLHKLGFIPRGGRGVTARVTTARRYRDCSLVRGGSGSPRDEAAEATVVRVHTEFEPPADVSQLMDTVDEIRTEGDLQLCVSLAQLRRALTHDEAACLQPPERSGD